MTTGRVSRRWFFPLCTLAVFAACFWLRADPNRDLISAGRASGGWSVRDYYIDSKQLKIEMAGSDATPLNSGVVLISNLVIKEWPITGGQPRATVMSPLCYYYQPTNCAFSSGPLQVRSDNGRLMLDGVGFRYEISNSFLAVSNSVHTVFYQSNSLAESEGRAKPSPTIVDSDSLLYGTKTGLAKYLGRVRVDDPRMKLQSEQLTAQFPPEGSASSQIQRILAEIDVHIQFINAQHETNPAGCDKAEYKYVESHNATNRIVELTGHAWVGMANGTNTADLFTYDSTEDIIRGIGNYRFHSTTNAQLGGASRTNSNIGETVITSGFFQYESKTGRVGYEGQVRFRNPQLDLDCELLHGLVPPSGAKTNFAQRIVAETNVIATFREKDGPIRATSGKLIYTYLQLTNGVITNELLNLYDDPVLERTNGWMAAGVITADRSTGKLTGRDRQHSVFKSAPTRSKTPASVIATNAIGTSDTEIFSDYGEFLEANLTAHFEGLVRAYNPEFTVTSGSLDIIMPPRGSTNSRPRHLDAATNVVIDAVDSRSVTNHASGDRLIYDRVVTVGQTNEILQLFGRPALLVQHNKDGVATTNIIDGMIQYDMINGVVTGRGQSDLGHYPQRPGTNPPVAPNPKPVGKP